jgi:hypothetical protein
MLPEIVRAAAEPMANIKDLTVLSTDGASELVRNGTRTVAEASAVVKGVTGIDIPALIGSAMGGRIRDGGDEGGSGSSSPGGGGGSGGGRGGGSRPRATAGRSPKPGATSPGPAATAGGGSTATAPTSSTDGGASATLSPAWGAPPTAARRSAPTSASTATAPASEPATGAAASEPSRDAMAQVDDALRKAEEATASALGGRPPEVQPPINRETTINAAAQRLARDLQAIPGIERFGALRLGELDRAGPRPLRTMWRIARDELGERYGEMTIGEVLDRYGRGGGSPGASA